MCVMKASTVIAVLLLGFGAGMAAQSAATSVRMQGQVMDANTLPEEIEYWELRGGSPGETIIVSGRKDLAIIRWLRQAKGRSAVLTVDRAEQASGARVEVRTAEPSRY
jgi:hypothetical protein